MVDKIDVTKLKEIESLDDIIASLHTQIPESDLKTRKGGWDREKKKNVELTYCPINKTIYHLNARAGARWGGSNLRMSVVNHKSTKWNKDAHKNEVIDATSVVVMYDMVLYSEKGEVLCSRPAVGASTVGAGRDFDMVVKSALAEATKKGANMYGFGNHLWDDDDSGSGEPVQTASLSEKNAKALKDIKNDIGLSKDDMSALLNDYAEANGASGKVSVDWLYKEVDSTAQDKRVKDFLAFIKAQSEKNKDNAEEGVEETI